MKPVFFLVPQASTPPRNITRSQNRAKLDLTSINNATPFTISHIQNTIFLNFYYYYSLFLYIRSFYFPTCIVGLFETVARTWSSVTLDAHLGFGTDAH